VLEQRPHSFTRREAGPTKGLRTGKAPKVAGTREQ
jgi:hypothetical protein